MTKKLRLLREKAIENCLIKFSSAFTKLPQAKQHKFLNTWKVCKLWAQGFTLEEELQSGMDSRIGYDLLHWWACGDLPNRHWGITGYSRVLYDSTGRHGIGKRKPMPFRYPDYWDSSCIDPVLLRVLTTIPDLENRHKLVQDWFDMSDKIQKSEVWNICDPFGYWEDDSGNLLPLIKALPGHAWLGVPKKLMIGYKVWCECRKAFLAAHALKVKSYRKIADKYNLNYSEKTEEKNESDMERYYGKAK